MLYLVIFFMLISFFTAILCLLKIYVLIEVKKNGSDDNIIFSFFTLREKIKFKYEITFVKLKEMGLRLSTRIEKGKEEKFEGTKESQFEVWDFFNMAKGIKVLTEKHKSLSLDLKRYLKNRIILKNMKLDMIFGVGEAHYTAILTGILWTLMGNLLAAASDKIKIEKTDINIKNTFHEKKVLLDLYCIFNFKIVNIIVVAKKILFYLMKRKLIKKENIRRCFKWAIIRLKVS